MHIQEGSRGINDPANAHWGETFGPHICGVCKHYVGKDGKRCMAGRRASVEAADEGCVKLFERKP
jgi:hypothetical protein